MPNLFNSEAWIWSFHGFPSGQGPNGTIWLICLSMNGHGWIKPAARGREGKFSERRQIHKLQSSTGGNAARVVLCLIWNLTLPKPSLYLRFEMVSVLDEHCCSGSTLVDFWLCTAFAPYLCPLSNTHTQEERRNGAIKISRERSRLSFIQNILRIKGRIFFFVLLGTDPVIKCTLLPFLFWGCIKWQSKAVEEVWAWKQNVSFTVSKVQEWNRARVNSKTGVFFFLLGA